jgi:AraC family transcriptional regulator
MQSNISSAISSGPLCRPRTASRFHVESEIYVNGFHADIRQFSWDHTADDVFEANSYYIDYSLVPRPRDTYLAHPGASGETVFLPKGSSFKAHVTPSTHRLLCLTFDDQRAIQLFEHDDLTVQLPPCLDLREPKVQRALARLADEVHSPGFARDVVLESVALLLVVDLCRHFRDRQSVPEITNGGIADWRLKRLQERIHHGLGETLSLSEMAELCGMSARHLNRTFKTTVGLSLGAYIAEARINAAKDQLARSSLPIKAIAGKTGFQTAAAFSAAFRKSTGLTPKQFRECRLS